MSNSAFAKRQLTKHGWTEGSGLGKQENGRSEPIKVSLKMDKSGVGHDPGKEFTDHWWLRVFNEAAQQIGKKQKDLKPNEENGSKQKKNSESKSKLYSNFVKSSTLTNGIEEKTNYLDSSSESSSDEENNISIPSLNDIHKFCGGATGHKAARFGIKMGGKLARVAKYDQMFEKSLKKQKLSLDVSTTDIANNCLPEIVKQESHVSNTDLFDKEICPDEGKRKKRKKHKEIQHSQEEGDDIEETNVSNNRIEQVDNLKSETVKCKSKIKKDKMIEHSSSNNGDNLGSELSENKQVQHSSKKRKKLKQKNKESICNNNELDEQSSYKKKQKTKEINSDELITKFSNQKKTKENMSGDEQFEETRSKNKSAKNNNSNELQQQSSSKKNKTEVNIYDNELNKQSSSKMKRETKDSTFVNDELEELPRKKNKKAGDNDKLLEESPSKKKSRHSIDNIELAEELSMRKTNVDITNCGELPEELSKKKKKKSKRQPQLS